jgi:hypothetical protein
MVFRGFVFKSPDLQVKRDLQPLNRENEATRQNIIFRGKSHSFGGKGIRLFAHVWRSNLKVKLEMD